MSGLRKPWTGRALRSVLLAGLLVLGGCASPPQTRVVLLPDADGHVGAVSVSSAAGRQAIDQGFAEVIARSGQAPTPSQPVDQPAFEQQNRQVLAAEPTSPKTFILNFRSDSMELTPQSKALLPEVLDTARQRMPTEISVFGHADALGAPSYNLDLSAQRARKVAGLLQRLDPKLRVNVEFFGDTAPLVPSRPGKSEPRNRRAEILIL